MGSWKTVHQAVPRASLRRRRVPRPTASPAALRFAMWLRRFGYVVFAFYLAWITLGPGEQDARLPPDPGRMISSGLLAISIAAIFFGILIVWGERQRLPPAVRRQARPPLKQMGVPRRFGVGVMLVIMTMYAMLFAALKDTDAVFFVVAAVFVTIIGLSQAILFKGHDPRKASVITGMALRYPVPRPRKRCHTHQRYNLREGRDGADRGPFPPGLRGPRRWRARRDCGLSGRPLDRRGLPAFQQGTAAAGRPRRGAGCEEGGSRPAGKRRPVGFLRSHCITLLRSSSVPSVSAVNIVLAPVPVAGGPASR